MPTTDLLLRGGTVVDGSGGPRRIADVAIAGGRIEAVGKLDAWRASRVAEWCGCRSNRGTRSGNPGTTRRWSSDRREGNWRR